MLFWIKCTSYFGNTAQYKISRNAMKKKYNKAAIICIPKHAQMSEKSPKNKKKKHGRMWKIIGKWRSRPMDS